MTSNFVLAAIFKEAIHVGQAIHEGFTGQDAIFQGAGQTFDAESNVHRVTDGGVDALPHGPQGHLAHVQAHSAVQLDVFGILEHFWR